MFSNAHCSVKYSHMMKDLTGLTCMIEPLYLDRNSPFFFSQVLTNAILLSAFISVVALATIQK